jgi:hypothetical protein
MVKTGVAAKIAAGKKAKSGLKGGFDSYHYAALAASAAVIASSFLFGSSAPEIEELTPPPRRKLHVADTVLAEATEYSRNWTQADYRQFQRNWGINREQPPAMPSFTKDGFKTLPIPPQVWEPLLAFHRAHKDAAETGESRLPGYVNNHIYPTKMNYLPPRLQDLVTTHVGKVLEGWIDREVYAGPTSELQATACYGIRKYVRHSTLQRHVDRMDTHAISAILNVEQAGLDLPWPLEILDHAGENHRVAIQPGEMVLYESAKLIHGRPHPFKGEAYYNVFVHFKPKHGWEEAVKGVEAKIAQAARSMKGGSALELELE